MATHAPAGNPRRIRWLLAMLLLGIAAFFASSPRMDADSDSDTSLADNLDDAAPQKSKAALRKNRPQMVSLTGRQPLTFEPNVGQSDQQVRFLSRSSRYTLFLTSSEAVFEFVKGSKVEKPPSAKLRFDSRRKTSPPQTDILRMSLAAANPHSSVFGLGQLPTRNNYFLGKDPTRWHRGVPTYSRVQYQEIYPGVNLVYYGNQRQLEYDFVVQPGADPGRIALNFSGSFEREGRALTLDAAGDLVIPARTGEVRFHKPVIYQPQEAPAGYRRAVEGSFVLLAKNRVGFNIAAYDKTKPLVIDPALNYATFLGGNNYDAGLAIAADSTGAAYVAGLTLSTNFPTSNSGTLKGATDAFVTKLNPTGTQAVYSTFIGGTDTEEAYGIAVDSNGNAFVTGDTRSSDFPATTGAYDTGCGLDGNCDTTGAFGQSGDAFVAKLDSNGALSWATFYGGNHEDAGYEIALGPNGGVAITGVTNSPIMPTTKNFQASCNNCGSPGFLYDAFVAEFDQATGANLSYASWIGGSAQDQGNGIAYDANGKIWIIGSTDSTDFPTTVTAPFPSDPDSGAFSDAFVIEIDPTLTAGATKVFSTYIGDNSTDFGTGLAFDGSGNLYIVGLTDFAHTPTGVSGFQSNNAGGTDVFVAKINPNTAQYIYATLLGGNMDEGAANIAVDGNGNAYVTGSTNSGNFPTANAVDGTFNSSGSGDAFVTEIAADGQSLVFSTYLGGEDFDSGQEIALSSSGAILVTGTTSSTDFPASTGALQTTCADTSVCNDGFVASYGGSIGGGGGGPILAASPSSLAFSSHLVGSATTMTVTVTNNGDANLTLSSMTLSGANAADFAMDASSTCSTSTAVTPTHSCTATVKFTPGAAGNRAASLAIASNGGSANVSLTGTGTEIALAAASGSSTSQTVTAGGTATFNLSMQPTGFVGDVTVACSGAPANSTCTPSPASAHLDGTTAASFSVAVKTAARALVAPPPDRQMPKLLPLQWMVLLGMLAGAGLLAGRRRVKLALAAALLGVVMLPACGGGGTPKSLGQIGTPAGNYNLTVTVTAGSVTRTLALALRVN